MASAIRATAGNKIGSERFVAFVDILYAVVLGYGFAELVQNTGLPMDPSSLVSSTGLLFTFAVVIFARDWVTYHRQIEKRPHVNVIRFVLDSLILFVFFLLVAVATRQGASVMEVRAFAGYCTVYFLLILTWQIVEWRYHGGAESREDREIGAETLWDLGYLLYFLAWYFTVRVGPDWTTHMISTVFVLMGFSVIIALHEKAVRARESPQLEPATTPDSRLGDDQG